MIAQSLSIVKKPICPTFVHDDLTRLIIIGVLLPVVLFILWKIIVYYERP